VADGSLSLHGAWHDIGSGKLHHFDPDQDGFVTL
jgi:carbonic anhydrase